MAIIRSGLLVLLICTLPNPASAGCGLFSPCGSPSWIGFSLALPVPRFPHLHTFCSQSCQSPMCGAGQPVGSCLFGNCGGGYPQCGGCCGTQGITPSYSPPMLVPQPTLPPTSCNPCGPALTQTQYVPQQTVTYRDVPQIQYRQEAYTASVPVTSYQQVTGYRNVPYQTVARIPQVSTQYVPQVTAAAPCTTCDTGMAMPYYAPTMSAFPSYTPTSVTPAQPTGVPEYPYPVPQPQASGTDGWQTVPQRQADASSVEQTGYYSHGSYRPRPSAAGMFRPAPSATAAWQSRFLR